jgi:diguanylate cyclase (GGDEF)-like protein
VLRPISADNAPPPCVLLVEDSPTTQAFLSKHLAHYRVIHASDGEEAWQMLLDRDDIEIVLTDIQMPKLNGHQLLVRIRKSTEMRIRSLPVIVMTAAGDKTDRDLAFLNGANDFITKPMDEIELQARIGVHYRLARTIRELEESRRQLAEQATTDPLTHLKNRRLFIENGDNLMASAHRHRTDVSVLVADLDHFKRINDTFGHHAGDEALVSVARTLTAMTRAEDTVARTGGEEFAVLMPSTNRLGAAVLAERIRAAVEREKILVGDRTFSLTISIGLASLAADGGKDVTDLLKIADRRLYLAKQNGRNRICVNDEGRANFAL